MKHLRMNIGHHFLSAHPNLRSQLQIKHQLLNSDVSSALDRNKTSDREAARLMIPMAAALGHDPMKLPLSRSTIQRARKRTRRDVADSVRHEFVPSYPLVVHWHRKALPDMFGEKDVERLAVLVSEMRMKSY